MCAPSWMVFETVTPRGHTVNDKIRYINKVHARLKTQKHCWCKFLLDLSQKTGIHVNDIISTLQYYGLVKYWRGEYWIMKNQVKKSY